MKKLISILGITTIGVNAIVVPIQNVSNKEEDASIKSNLKINEQNKQNNIDIVEQWYLKITDNKQEAIFKDNLLLAISLKDQQINFDLNKINKTLWNNADIYNLISNPKYIKNLQLMYKSGDLQFINDKAQFIEKPNQYRYKGIWTESHWYWFGYWKLHIGHVECQDFIYWMYDHGSFVRIVNSAISRLGGWIATISLVVVGFLYANTYIMMGSDRGNGVWIGWYGPVPDLGWGSD